MVPHEEYEQVGEVCLAGQDLAELCLVEYGSYIRRIDLSYNSLVSLRGLHVCADTLEELILDNNLLERVDFRAEFPKLHTLSLNKNKINDVSSLLQELSRRVKNLRHLSLLGNPICPDQLTSDLVEEKDYQLYRCHVLFHLRNVRFLDHRQVLPRELKESRKLTYAHIRIVPSYTPLTNSFPILPPLPSPGSEVIIRERHNSSGSDSASNSGNISSDTNVYGFSPTGLPSSDVVPGIPAEEVLSRGKTGKRKFRYIGKNSEGNRFIKDSDL